MNFDVMPELHYRYSYPAALGGMVAADVLRGDMPISHWDGAEKAFLLDVREGEIV